MVFIDKVKIDNFDADGAIKVFFGWENLCPIENNFSCYETRISQKSLQD